MFGSKKKQFVSIVKQDKQLKVNYKILQDNKIFKEENSTFVAAEPTMPKDALVKLDVLQKDIPHTYLISIYDQATQKVLPTSEIDVISYESVKLDSTTSVAVAKNELASYNRYFANSGIDYLISPFSIISEYTKELGVKNSLNVFIHNNVLYMVFLDGEQKIAHATTEALTPFEKIKQEQFSEDEIVDQKLYDEVSFLEIQQFLNDAIEEYYELKEDVEFLEGMKFLYTLSPFSNDQMESLHDALMVEIEYEPLELQRYLDKFIQKESLESLSLLKPRAKVAPKSMKGWTFLTILSLIAVIAVVYFKLDDSIMMEEQTAKQAQNVQKEVVEVKQEIETLEKNIPLTLPNHTMLNRSTLERINMHFDIIPYDAILKDLELLEESSTFVTYFAVPTTAVEDMQTKLLNIYKDSKVLLKHQNKALLNVIIENNGLVVDMKTIPYARYNKDEYLSIGKATEYITKLLPLQSSMKFLKKEQKENLEYQFTVTSIVKTPDEFFNLINKLSGEIHSVYIQYPIVFSKLNEGIEVKYIITLFQAPKESPKPKS